MIKCLGGFCKQLFYFKRMPYKINSPSSYHYDMIIIEKAENHVTSSVSLGVVSSIGR